MLKDKLELLSKKTAEIQKMKADLVTESAKVFDEFRKDFFSENPKIKSFSWVQYTPYFNDGDTCVFSVNTDYIKVNNEHVDDCEWYEPTRVTSWGKLDPTTKKYVGRVEVPNLSYDKELSDGTDVIKDFLDKFDNDFYMKKFGDHVEVTVSAGGIETEDYEHE